MEDEPAVLEKERRGPRRDRRGNGLFADEVRARPIPGHDDATGETASVSGKYS